MSEDVLLLNSDGQPLSMLPLSTLSWKDAIRLEVLDKIDIIEYYENWEVHSATMTFRVPTVVMAKKHVKRRTNVCLTRANLYLRDRYTCQYCNNQFGWHDLTIDHVIPVSKGGYHDWDNLVAACKDCNSRKSDKIIDPSTTPYEPTYWDLAKKRVDIPIIIRHYSWKRFITPGKGGFQLLEPSYA